MQQIWLQESADNPDKKVCFEVDLNGPVINDTFFERRLGLTKDGPCMLKSALGSSASARLKHEVQVVERLRGGPPQITAVLGSDINGDHARALFTCVGEPLSRQGRFLPLQGRTVRQAATDLFTALSFVAGQGYVHGDVSPEAVLWNGMLKFQLSGFGDARRGQDGGDDVHMAAVLLYYLATGDLPDDSPGFDLIGHLSGINPGLAEFLRPALAPETGRRPTAAEMLLRLEARESPNGRSATAAPPRPPAGRPPPQARRPRQAARHSQAKSEREHTAKKEFHKLREDQAAFHRSERPPPVVVPPSVQVITAPPPVPNRPDWRIIAPLATVSVLLVVLILLVVIKP